MFYLTPKLSLVYFGLTASLTVLLVGCVTFQAEAQSVSTFGALTHQSKLHMAATVKRVPIVDFSPDIQPQSSRNISHIEASNSPRLSKLKDMVECMTRRKIEGLSFCWPYAGHWFYLQWIGIHVGFHPIVQLERWSLAAIPNDHLDMNLVPALHHRIIFAIYNNIGPQLPDGYENHNGNSNEKSDALEPVRIERRISNDSHLIFALCLGIGGLLLGVFGLVSFFEWQKRWLSAALFCLGLALLLSGAWLIRSGVSVSVGA